MLGEWNRTLDAAGQTLLAGGSAGSSRAMGIARDCTIMHGLLL